MNKSIAFLKETLISNETIIVSCSGGPDSMCLLDLLIKLKKELNIKIIVAHVNHNIRKVSKKEEKFVREYCNQNNLIYELLNIFEYSSNFQKSARDQRYKFLKILLEKYNSKTLLTAHHADDLIETILMRLSRGSKIQGYAGFRKVNQMKDYKVLRPLVFYNKKEILNYNKVFKVSYKVDRSNFKKDYTRNKFRIKILPILYKFNKDVNLKYLKYSDELFEYYDYLNEVIINKKIIIDKKLYLIQFNNETDFIKKKSIELLLTLYQEETELEVNDNSIKEIIKLINSKKQKATINLANGYLAVKKDNILYLKKDL